MRKAFFILLLLFPHSASADASAIEKLAQHEAELRKTKNYVAQGKRLEEFSCASDLKDLSKSYARQRRHLLEGENILDNEKRRQTSFASLPPEERRKLGGLFPENFGCFLFQMTPAEVAGDRLTLILATMMRETDFQLFLDEDSPGEMLTGKGTRAGAGLMQMTAWNEEYVKKWGKHDFEQYASGRRGEFLPNVKDYLTPGKSRSLRYNWLPMSVDLETKKDDIRTANQFVKSPYNPAVAFWYGRHAMTIAENKVAALGVRDMDPSNRAAILGFFYNAGVERLKCLTERVKIWNQSFPNDQLAASKWESLRPLIYFDPELSAKAGIPEELSAKLAAACSGQEKCSCLDQEPPGPRSALRKNDFKAAVSANYGDHMFRLQQCFSGFVEDLQSKYSRLAPSECR